LRAQAAADTYRQLSLFGDVFERLRADYVEKPDDSKLIESAINRMLAGLDPHSGYMDSKSFRRLASCNKPARCGTPCGDADTELAEYWRQYLANDAQYEWAARARRALKFWKCRYISRRPDLRVG
jgi:hypothetical protein